MHLSPHTVARAIGVAPLQLESLTREKASITSDTAVRLARYFGTTVQFWMGLQAQHDLEYARKLLAGSPRRSEIAPQLTA
jgi:addiction module HigA family antidote